MTMGVAVMAPPAGSGACWSRDVDDRDPVVDPWVALPVDGLFVLPNRVIAVVLPGPAAPDRSMRSP